MKCEILKDIFFIGSGRFHYTNSTNCNIYLVDGGSEFGLIDTGSGIKMDSVLESIRNHGFDPSKIGVIINTHAHWDHARGDARIKAMSNCKIAVHKLGVSVLEKGPWSNKLKFQPVTVDIKLDDSDAISIGKHRFTVVWTPGHTSDSICLMKEQEGRKLLFSGDTVQAFGIPGVINSRCDFPAYEKSMQKLSSMNIDVLLPGHGIFLLSDAHEQIRFLSDKLAGSWQDFVSFPQPFAGGSWELKQHPEWLNE